MRKEQHWFKLWVIEGYSIRQLSHISGHSPFKLKRIKNYWLSKEPPALSQRIYTGINYLVFDGTYFHKDGCLAMFMNTVSRKPVYVAYIERENYENVIPLVTQLRDKGVIPIAVTTDGHPRVIRALQEVWPNTVLQRCLFHIQNQGLMWLRTYPKTEAGKELRSLYVTIANIRTQNEMFIFHSCYNNWHEKHKTFICSLPRHLVAFKDLKRVRRLLFANKASI
ncbi:MAG: transposase [Elusimicrobia bacterium]|nr:transposase [Elusimicrobiota bacterium]